MVRFEVFMAMTMKNIMLFTNPKDGGDTFLQNVGSNQSHMVLHSRRRYFSRSYRIEKMNLLYIFPP
jgi:hypothetical protein